MVAPKTEPASTPAGKPTTIDEYIAGYPDEVRGMLQRVRTAISDQVPGFSEKIRYGMPAIMLGSTNDPTRELPLHATRTLRPHLPRGGGDRVAPTR